MGKKLDAGCHARAGEGYGLRAAGGVVGDGNGAGLAAGGRGSERDTDRAVGAGGNRMSRRCWSGRTARWRRCW